MIEIKISPHHVEGNRRQVIWEAMPRLSAALTAFNFYPNIVKRYNLCYFLLFPKEFLIRQQKTNLQSLALEYSKSQLLNWNETWKSPHSKVKKNEDEGSTASLPKCLPCQLKVLSTVLHIVFHKPSALWDNLELNIYQCTQVMGYQYQ